MPDSILMPKLWEEKQSTFTLTLEVLGLQASFSAGSCRSLRSVGKACNFSYAWKHARYFSHVEGHELGFHVKAVGTGAEKGTGQLEENIMMRPSSRAGEMSQQ